MSSKTCGLFIEDERQQRAGLFLRDVEYVVHAHFEMTERAGQEDNVAKHQEMFLRRAEKGQCFHRPYLGCREFAAYFTLLATAEKPESKEKTSELGFEKPRDLGYMLLDVEHDNSQDKGNVHFCGDKCRPYFFNAVLKNGSLKLDGAEVRS